MSDICHACGWGATVQAPCRSIEQVVMCCLNWENRRKYALRYKDRDTPVVVRSVRYMGTEGKGDSSEQLAGVDIEQLRHIMG